MLVTEGPEEMAFGPVRGIPNPMTIGPLFEPELAAPEAVLALVAPVLEPVVAPVVAPVLEPDFDEDEQAAPRSNNAATKATPPTLVRVTKFLINPSP
jgi:hypothetical protein